MFDVQPPAFAIGDTLRDEMVGSVEVVAEADGWPLYQEPPRRGPNPSRQLPILCGDLVRAVCDETIEDVAEHWGVPPYLVRQWRQAIAGQDNGIEVAIALRKADPKFRRKFWRSA
jgi:hypothetical protein